MVNLYISNYKGISNYLGQILYYKPNMNMQIKQLGSDGLLGLHASPPAGHIKVWFVLLGFNASATGRVISRW